MQESALSGKYGDVFFFTGFKSQVDQRLQRFFDECEANKQKGEQLEMYTKMSEFGRVKSKSGYATQHEGENEKGNAPKEVQIHFLLFDLGLSDFNEFQAQIAKKFKETQKKNQNVQFDFIPIDTMAESTQFIEKIQKLISPEYQYEQTFNKIVNQVTQRRQTDLIKSFLTDKLQWEKKSAIKFLNLHEINSFEEFFDCETFTERDQIEVDKLIENINLLSELFEGQGQSDDDDSDDE